jgi:hypothetical protein
VSGRYEALLAELAAEFPRFRVVEKAGSRLHRAIDRALRILSLGRIDDYLDGFHVTLGQTVYVTSAWATRDADERWAILRHEAVHLRQFRRFTPLGMAILYLLLPLPLGLAWCRARMEMAAYAESIRAAAALRGVDHVRAGGFRDEVVAQFTGPSYGWMWPFRRAIERWYDGVVAEVVRGPEPGSC